jgi:hypothetical protein
VEAIEFPDPSERLQVRGAPQININQGAGTVGGAVPAQDLLIEIEQALAG